MLIRYSPMKHWPILLCVTICGCTERQPHPPATTTVVVVQAPVVAGNVEVMIGEGRVIIAPPDSATAGSKWIEHAVTYANKTDRSIWIVGYAANHPFSGIETRANEEGEWRDYGLGYCGTGAEMFEIAPGASYSFTAALPEKYVSQEFRVTLPYLPEHAVVSRALMR